MGFAALSDSGGDLGTAYRGLFLRILHTYKLYQPDEPGGIPTVITGLIGDRKASHSVLTARRSGWGGQFTFNNTPVTAVASLGTAVSTPIAPGYIPAFLQRARQADLVVHHAPFPLTDVAIMLGLPRHVALVIYWHADILAYPKLKALLAPALKYALQRADKIVVSAAPMIEGSPLLKTHVQKCEVIPYGTDVGFWQILSSDDATQVNELKRQHPRHIVALGRLVPYKGFKVLVRAMQDVDAHATVIGDGPLLGELQQLATELGVANRIEFPGELDNRSIKNLLHAAQCFAFPSLTDAEAFGLVQIEAMAAGLPIVNTQLKTTVPLVARHNREGLTVPVGDPSALAQALNSILDNSNLASRLSTAAIARAHSEYDHRIFLSRMTAVYENALEARRRAC